MLDYITISLWDHVLFPLYDLENDRELHESGVELLIHSFAKTLVLGSMIMFHSFAPVL